MNQPINQPSNYYINQPSSHPFMCYINNQPKNQPKNHISNRCFSLFP
ncbi:hypothetical protein [Moorena sp. SIO4A5]